MKPDKISDMQVEILTVKALRTNTSAILLSCQFDDTICTPFMPKALAEHLWKNTSSTEIITIVGTNAGSILLMCQFDDTISTLHMPKELAEELWKSTSSSEIIEALKAQQEYTFVVQSQTIIRLSGSEHHEPSTSLPKPSTVTSKSSTKRCSKS